MIEISDGFTRIDAGADNIVSPAQGDSGDSGESLEIWGVRCPTGARVTVEFRRERALTPAQMVKVRYDFAGNGSLREGTGIATLIETVVHWGYAVAYRYRISYWIAPAALMKFELGKASYPERGSKAPAIESAHWVRASDPIRA